MPVSNPTLLDARPTKSLHRADIWMILRNNVFLQKPEFFQLRLERSRRLLSHHFLRNEFVG